MSVVIEGKTYELAWGNLARARYSGIAPDTRAAGGVVPMITMLWASVAAKPHPYPTWEHLAEHISEKDIGPMSEALEAVLPAIPDAEKKSTSETGPLPASPSA